MKKLNTKIYYMYRDASNYKQNESVVFSEKIKREHIDIIMKKMEEEEYFIPSQIGLADLQPRMTSYPSSDDHVWHEITDIQLTEEAPTDSRDIQQFVDELLQTEWDVLAATEKHGF